MFFDLLDIIQEKGEFEIKAGIKISTEHAAK